MGEAKRTVRNVFMTAILRGVGGTPGHLSTRHAVCDDREYHTQYRSPAAIARAIRAAENDPSRGRSSDLGHLLQQAEACLEEAPHVPIEERTLRDPAEDRAARRSRRRRGRGRVALGEEVVVVEAPNAPCTIMSPENGWPRELRDARLVRRWRTPKWDRFPGDLVVGARGSVVRSPTTARCRASTRRAPDVAARSKPAPDRRRDEDGELGMRVSISVALAPDPRGLHVVPTSRNADHAWVCPRRSRSRRWCRARL